MSWVSSYPKSDKPLLEQIASFIACPLWQDFCAYVEVEYKVMPTVEYSMCAAAPGWNVKYKKGGRSLCTLYPHEGYFTCLVCIGAKEVLEAELVMPIFTAYTRALYERARPVNGTRWLMMDVTGEDILEDAKRLLLVREKPRPQTAGKKRV
ncbi:hypothetical protein SDC9_73835 [bioreactor metagenome]|uniref:DUF3788 domain-containing protein n=1 Tax=bioreactor metagenome TaxID=1076179 RepID=A0A644YFG7_9ZZZZ